MKLLISTNNKDKQREFAQVLSGMAVELVFPQDIGLGELEVDESGDTFEENARLKAVAFANASGLLTVADDSGMEIEALGGAPGVHSKRFVTGSDSERRKKVLELMEEKSNRNARFRCTLVLIDPKTNLEQVFVGDFDGEISREELGDEGFGLDPVFVPKGETKTVAQLGNDYKNEHSHRALAIKKLATYLESLVDA